MTFPSGKILEKYLAPDSQAFSLVKSHGESVAKKAAFIAQKHKLSPSRIKFIEEAALLHDIGIVKVKAPLLGCHGEKPYVWHGVFGREILEAENLPEHALVCERHVGVGISIQDIEEQKLDLPRRDMTPKTIEEKIIAYADKFFSKTDQGELSKEKTVAEILKELEKFGADKPAKFLHWVEEFEPELLKSEYRKYKKSKGDRNS